MSDFSVTIVGTGVIGASLGLALKQFEDAPRVLGHDKELTNAQAAAKKGAVDKAEWNLVHACEPADLIILAIPLNGVRPTLEAIAPYLKEGVVISDTSRSKGPVLTWAEEHLPDHAHFIGGDPIVNPTGNGPEYAGADLFQNRFYCLTPSPTAAEGAVQLLVDVINMIGARPFFLDAAEHDGLMTAVEHLPAALGVALLNTLSSQSSWREIRKMTGSLFEQASAGVVGETNALKDDFLSNRKNLGHWLDSYIQQLSQLRVLLADADSEEALAQMLDSALVERYNWQVDYKKEGFVDPELKPVDIKTPGFMKRLVGLRR